MAILRLARQWIAPISVALIGIAISCAAYWMADRLDERRVEGVLEFRTEWRARDLEAKIRLSGNAVENVAIAMAINPGLAPDQFARLAARARLGIDHVNALEWAPRVKRGDVAAFERSVRADGPADYRVFDVTEDLRPTALTEREEYFPVRFDTRPNGRSLGLALGRFDGRRIPMEKARDQGVPISTLPVRPIGAPSQQFVYLLFWPVYETIEVPYTVGERRNRFRGYAVGNYDLAALLNTALRDTPPILGSIRFSIAAAHPSAPAANAVAVYTPESGRVATGALPADAPIAGGTRVTRHFDVFDQHWDVTFDYGPAAIAELRSNGAWGWLLAGLLLTASLVFYLVHERGRRETIEALVRQRTLELERTNAQLQQAQKMEAIGNLTGGMAHDFNNLLMIVIGNLELLRDDIKDNPKIAVLAEAALQAGARGAELTRRLLAFARRQPLEPRVTDVNALVSGMTRLLQRMVEENIKIILVTGPGVWAVMIDPAQLESAITNLITNARDAMPAGGQITVETRNTHLDEDYAALNPEVVPGDFVLIEISDGGVGMSPETLVRAFEPFFTTKEPGSGTGLGLSMVFGFVKQSQGHIKIYSEESRGTTVRLYLPRFSQSAAASSPADHPHEATVTNGSETILLVEDNADVRRVVSGQLAELGYKVMEAENGPAAMKIICDPVVPIDLLFTDLVMPAGMNGHELARAALAVRPALSVLFTSGYPGHSLREDDRLKDGEQFISKPFRKQDLARKLRECLAAKS